jgi:L-asparaginase
VQTRSQGKKIVVLGTGGTIAGTAASPTDRAYVAAQKGVAELLAGLPLPQSFELVSEQVAQIDSKDMDLGVWQALLRRCQHWLAQPEVQSLVITHGTDTLEETAYLLQALLAPTKPVVLTCAMRPATAIDADGPQNLLDAFAVAAEPGAHGVVVVCAGRIHSAFDVQKAHTWQLDAFTSGEAGDLGQVVQGRVVLWRNWPVSAVEYAPDAIEKIANLATWPRVEIVLSHAAVTAATIDALVAPDVAARFGAPPVRGLVVAATGNGTLHQALEVALQRAVAQGVRVVRATRCAQGRVWPRPGDAWPDSQGLSPVKARLALMLSLV